MTQLHARGDPVYPLVPEVGEVAVPLLLRHQTVAVSLYEASERGNDVNRIASNDNHFVDSVGTSTRHGLRVVRLCDPDAVIIADDVFPEHAQRKGLMEDHFDIHVIAGIDACDLLDIPAQECVAASWKRLKRNVIT